MPYLTLTPENLSDQHICCGFADKKIAAGYQAKKELLVARFAEGFRFRKLDARGKVFIEYVPAEYAWAPVVAPGYMFIHCFWVSGKFKGQGHGAALLKACEEDSRDKQGLVAIAAGSKKPFLSDKSYYLHHGFAVCDAAPPYFELLVKPLKPGGEPPRFAGTARSGHYRGGADLTMFYSHQCPFTEHWTEAMIRVAEEYQLSTEKIHIASREEAQQSPTPFTIFSVYLHGKFLTHEMMGESKFRKTLEGALAEY